MYRVLLLLALLADTTQAAEVRVLALFKGAALLSIDGRQHLLRAGQNTQGVYLVDADTRAAVVEVDGQRREMGLSPQRAGNYKEAQGRELGIPRNDRHEYRTTAILNGHRLEVVVDTGANIIAMSSAQARALGIRYLDGQPAQVTTAGGISPAYRIMLDSVDVGGLLARHVPAVVIEGQHPLTVLLGMSFLQHVDIEEKGNILYLRQLD